MFDFLRKRKFPGPDFSEVDSPDKAAHLVNEGILAKMLLLPEIFGGGTNINNILYVPVFVVTEKARVDEGIIVPLVKSGTVTQYTAKPKYSGRSIVPIIIEVNALNPGNFKAVIKVWGKGLA